MSWAGTVAGGWRMVNFSAQAGRGMSSLWRQPVHSSHLCDVVGRPFLVYRGECEELPASAFWRRRVSCLAQDTIKARSWQVPVHQ